MEDVELARLGKIKITCGENHSLDLYISFELEIYERGNVEWKIPISDHIQVQEFFKAIGTSNLDNCVGQLCFVYIKDNTLNKIYSLDRENVWERIREN